MKKIIIILFVLAVAVVSCNKSGTDSKKTELASLKKQQAELSSKILKMEEELAKENTFCRITKSKQRNFYTLCRGTG